MVRRRMVDSDDEDDEESRSQSMVDQDEDDSMADVERPAVVAIGAREKTIEERYTKMTPLQHILARPDTYVGSLVFESSQAWTWSSEESRMVYRTVNYVPAMLNIFDEIIVNAADVKAREMHEGKARKNRMTKIEVTIDPDRNNISVYNDGSGIPVEVHKEHGMYVPELIFGHLLTSDNYDDSDARVTGGRNGYGAKLANIFSTKFQVEVTDSTRKKKFKMSWSNNMNSKSEPEISPWLAKTDYVRISFFPDLKRFKRPSLEPDLISLMQKRVHDIAGTTGVKVHLNGDLIPVSDFRTYVDLYFKKKPATDITEIGSSKPPGSDEGSSVLDDDDEDDEEFGANKTRKRKRPKTPAVVTEDGNVKIWEKVNDRWEIVVSQSEGQFQHVSFVNSICTSKGGSHVAYVADQLVAAVQKKAQAKNKGGIEIKPHHVRNHLFIFVNCLIVNPTFDTQTKETMTLRVSMFGSQCVISDKIISAVVKSPITESVLLWAQTKQQVDLQRKLRTTGSKQGGRDRIVGIPKLDDANDAGTRFSGDCTLILTEGDSAKTSCIAGLSVVGRDRYGVFPLRGKVLNVREASFKKLTENAEIQNILTITGLQVGKKFTDPRGLRYGSIMIMTDQDHDGSHIKGLLINLLQHYWPDLLKFPGFLKEFVTPIVKVTKGRDVQAFYTLTEYEHWKEQIGFNNLKSWKVKYYKGLGTSDNKEFAEYFSDLPKHQLVFSYVDESDFEAIDMAFNAKRVEDRKNWIQSFQEGTYIDHRSNHLRYRDFINKELVQFSRYDVERSIPSIMDGCKPGQRKALFGSFKKGLAKREIKVAQLAAYVAEVSCYHHGEDSMAQTLVGMAQTFVGSNNLNVLFPSGQFGSRKEGGKDASATRYIYTKLSPVALHMFHPCDDALLHFNNEEGKVIEPKWYVPVIPLVLVNGAEGIGTGWSSSVPNFNPKDIIENIRRYLQGQPMLPMEPWYKGFTGRIEKAVKSYESVGNISVIDDQTVVITELPVRVWTQTYKEFLEELLQAGITAEQEQAGAVRAKAKPKAKAKAKSKAAVVERKPFVRQHIISIQDYRDNSTHESINFTIKLAPDQLALAEAEGLEKVFRLRKNIAMTNMTLFDHTGRIVRYESELDIMREFCQVRLQYYHKRRQYQLTLLEKELCLISNKLKFILMVVQGTLIVQNKRRKMLEEDLDQLGFDKYSVIEEKYDTTNTTMISDVGDEDAAIPSTADNNDDDDATASLNKKAGGFDYLLNQQIANLTYERIEELKKKQGNKEEELERYRNITAEQLWLTDLDSLEICMQQQDDLLAQQVQAAQNLRNSVAAGARAGRIVGRTRQPLEKKPKQPAKAMIKQERKPAEDPATSPSRDFSIMQRLRDKLLQKEQENQSPIPTAAFQQSTLDHLLGNLQSSLSIDDPKPSGEPVAKKLRTDAPQLVAHTVRSAGSSSNEDLPLARKRPVATKKLAARPATRKARLDIIASEDEEASSSNDDDDEEEDDHEEESSDEDFNDDDDE